MTSDPRCGTFSLSEAAVILGISLRTARDLTRRDGQLVPGVPVFRVGTKWKVSRVALERFLEAGAA